MPFVLICIKCSLVCFNFYCAVLCRAPWRHGKSFICLSVTLVYPEQNFFENNCLKISQGSPLLGGKESLMCLCVRSGEIGVV